MEGIVAYKFTFDIEGTISPLDPENFAALGVTSWQAGVPKGSSSTYYASPLGPVSFYVQPKNLLDPFDVNFQLDTFAYGSKGGTVDFSNTASFVSMEAIDASGNVIPGIELVLGDGMVMDANGLESSSNPASPAPEPSTFMMFGTGLLGVAGAVRRRLMV